MKVLDLFCGAGGLSMGFSKEGFSVTGADINKKSGETFSLNEIGDFIQIDLAEESVTGTFDVVVGGPPCRPWSAVNVRKRGNLHPDYTLLESFFNHIFSLKPRAFLVENVPPLAQDDGFKSLIKQTRREGYSVDYRTVKYLDYGAATGRRRLITTGFREFGLNAADFFNLMDKQKEKPLTVGEAIRKYDGLAEGDFPDHEWPKLKTIEKYLENYETGKYGWSRLSYDGYSPSFTNIMKTYLLHPRAEEDNFPLRVISVREALEIMGFPRSFRFPEGMGMSMKYQMVANSVSPLVARKMAIVLKTIMESQGYLKATGNE